MGHPKPYPRCVFCGARANSREHAVPGWIARRLGIKEFLTGGNLTGERRKQPISFASYRARIFCSDCNTHFKHLEDAVIPLLEPMARGRFLGLDEDSQALLGLWASKTAIALIAANNRAHPSPETTVVVPANHCRSVREDGSPSRDVWAGFVPWQGKPVINTGEAVLFERPEHRATEFEAYLAILAFERVAFKVVGFMSGPPPPHVIDGERGGIVQVWPRRRGLVHWPAPGPPVTPASYAALVNFVPLRRA